MSRSYTHAQHFLSGPRLVAELIGHTNIRKNDVVYDLGAGSGVISYTLAPRCKEVIAVEVEPNALLKLRNNISEIKNISIVEKSILEIDTGKNPYKIFSNIPFSLSAQIVREFTESDNPPKAMYLIVQKQFARKLVPSDTHFTAQLGAQLGPLYSARIRRPLRKSDFTPPPAVDTVLLELKLRDQPMLRSESLPVYREFVARCFAEQKFFTRMPREKAGISAEKIPSQLSIDQWVKLYESSR